MNTTSPFPGVVDPIAFVRAMACQVTALYPSCLHLDDVAAEGLLALVLALRRFDARRGVRFSTYAWSRVRGAMFDLVRAESRRRRFLKLEDGIESSTDTSVEDLVLARDRFDHVHRAAGQLPVRQGQYVNGLLMGDTEVSVCRRMRITRGAGRELRARALRNLKRELGGSRDLGASEIA